MPILPDTLPGEKLLIRLWDTIERFGIGLLNPLQLKREGRARAEVRRHEMLLDAQTQKEIEGLMAGRLTFDSRVGRLLPATTIVPQERKEPQLIAPYDHKTLFRAAERREAADDMYRLLNLRRTVAMAEEEIENAALEGGAAAEEAAQPIDPDWAYRWKEKAEQISIEETQRLWAKVLAGENNRPGSYSLRTLDLLFSLRKSDADLIAKAGNFCFDRGIIYGIPEYLEKHGLTFGELLELEDIGVLTGVAGLGSLQSNYPYRPFVLPDGSQRQIVGLIYNDKKAIVVEKGDKDVLTIPGYLLTTVGKELIRLGKFDVDVDFLNICAKRIKEEQKLNVSVADYMPVSGDAGRLFNLVQV